MNEHDDYLFDPATGPDPEVVALERALLPLRWREAPLRPAPPPLPAPAPAAWRRPWPWLVAALLGLSIWLWSARDVALQPASASRTFVAGKMPVEIPLGELATITLRPGSELKFAHWRPDQALFALQKGGLQARVAPPPKVMPGFFAVDTPLGRVVDQGCRYELELHDDGSIHIRVTEGAVTFAAGDRTVYVPAAATTVVTAKGASTPLFVDADAGLRRAVRDFDALRQRRAPVAECRARLQEVLAAARTPRASLPLWHLLRDPEPELRASTEAFLIDLVGPPDGGKTKDEQFDPELWLPFLRFGAWQTGG